MSSRLDILGYVMPTEILSEIFSNFLSLEDICPFDSALCNKKKRSLYLEFIGLESCIWQGDRNRNFNFNAISWLQTRSIKVRHLKCNATDDIAAKIGSFGRFLHWLSISDDKHTLDENLAEIRVAIIDECPNLLSLEIPKCRFKTDDSIIRLAERCLHLNTLDLGNVSTDSYNTITDRCIERLGELHPNLESLSLLFGSHITDKSIIKIAENCSHLHSLNLRFCYEITDVSIIKIAQKCMNLHTLNLEGNKIISDRSMIVVGNSCLNLRNLNLQDCINITDSGIIELAEGCPDLRILNISACIPRPISMFTDVCIIRLAEKCPKLTSLNLRNCTSGITDFSIVLLSKGCPDIQTLQIYNCRGVTMKLKKLKETFPNLKYVV